MHTFNYHRYYDGPSDHEFSRPVNDVIVHVSKVGGGTAGKRYSGAWAYSVTDSAGKELIHGDDMTTGHERSHNDVAVLVAEFLPELIEMAGNH